MNKKEVLEKIKRLNLPSGQYVVVGGGVLAVHNLRETNDIDIVAHPALFKSLQKQGWTLDKDYEQKWGAQRLKKDDIEIHPAFLFTGNVSKTEDLEKLIQEADIIGGIPFETLEHLLFVKKNAVAKRIAVREKDVKDVALLEGILRI